MVALKEKAFEIAPELSDGSKVWIYQSDREFTSEEATRIAALSQSFISEWKAHGTKLKADALILFNRFVCIFADESETGASGCSIDSSVRFVQNLEREFGLNFMNRELVAVLADSDKIITLNLRNLNDSLGSGEINRESLVFNNLVKTKGEMNTSWLLPLSESWHSRFLD